MADYENQSQPEYTEHPKEEPENGREEEWQPQNDNYWQPQGQMPPQGPPQNDNYWQPQGPVPPQGQPPYNNGPGNYNPYGNVPPKRPQNGFATVSLICGIFGVLCLCCFAFPLAIIMGVGAILFAIISKKEQPLYGTAVAGVIFGSMAVVLGVCEFFYIMHISTLLKDPENAAMINEFLRQLEQQLKQ